MSRSKYLTAAVPKVSGGKTNYGGGQAVAANTALEQRIAELNEQMIKQNRDNEDAMNNVDEDNLSESLMNIIRDLQRRVKALEEGGGGSYTYTETPNSAGGTTIEITG